MVLRKGETAVTYRELVQKLINGETVEICHTPEYTAHYDPPVRLVIFGGGHVGRCVASLGRQLGYEVRIYDDRKEFATDPVIYAPDFKTAIGKMRDSYYTYYVCASSGPAADEICVRELLKRDCAYVGMLGSAKKAASISRKLLSEGMEPGQVARLHSPVGLKIGAQTPMEIAVSILGEIIQVHHRTEYRALDPDILASLKPDAAEPVHGRTVFATIIRTEGTTPRSAGSKMMVCEDGRIFGSVGGGKLEYTVIHDARTIKHGQVKGYDMIKTAGEEFRMSGGGHVEILYEVEND